VSLGKEARELRKLGMETVMNLIYSISPRHTDEYYAQKARDAAASRPHRICFKDVGGMLTPERTHALVRLIQQNIGDTPLEFHAHCNNGLAPFNLLEAVKEGVRIVHTAIPPLANGSSQPYGGAHLSDEELLLRFYAGPEFVDALTTAPPRKEYLSATKPLVRLIEELGKKKLRHVQISTGDFALTIHLRSRPAARRC
jgi:hypothetical protein